MFILLVISFLFYLFYIYGDHPFKFWYNKHEVEEEIKEWKKQFNKYVFNKQLIENPVIIETGQIYERNYIEKWFEQNNTCPNTGLQLETKFIVEDNGFLHEIEKLIEKVYVWYKYRNLIPICKELTDELLDLFNKDSDNVFYDTSKSKLILLKIYILLRINYKEEQILDEYLNLPKDIFLLPMFFEKFEKIFTKKDNLQKYYEHLLQLFISQSDRGRSLNKAIFYFIFSFIFQKYNELNFVNDNLIDLILTWYTTDLKCFNLVSKNKNYDKNKLLLKLINFKLFTRKPEKKSDAFRIFKEIFSKVNLQTVDLYQVLNFINDSRYYNEEKIIIYKELYKNTKDIKYLEWIYEINKNDKQNKTQLLNEYFKLNLYEKCLSLYVTIKEEESKLIETTLLKYLQCQNEELQNILQENNNKIGCLNNELQTSLQHNKDLVQRNLLLTDKIKELETKIPNKKKKQTRK
ncbi:hypothetical protein ABK040_010080 [Willaertia magna]